ncbi:putative holin-like toxin [Paenibacillus spongiae]|uniref:Holin-like toxin n=1 Tax=Paenibacillus spongiae TaxID=2909671 RepID=A0ABY5SEQ1_9BACL|nr:putative holin-like toxin [Paenibacillus spongiae]UVI32003.1 putative holin-like toxin [Paenibacillus spongiae]
MEVKDVMTLMIDFGTMLIALISLIVTILVLSTKKK